MILLFTLMSVIIVSILWAFSYSLEKSIEEVATESQLVIDHLDKMDKRLELLINTINERGQ